MIRRNTWILLGVLVVVLLAGWYIQRPKKPAATDGTPTPGPALLFNIAENEVASISIEASGGGKVVLGRDQAGVWAVTEPQGGETDLAQAESGISQLTQLRGTPLAKPNADLSIYGLTEPPTTITINLNGGEKHILVVGDITPTESNYYVQLDGGSPQLVSKYSLDPVLNMLKSPPLKATATSPTTLTNTPETGLTGTSTPSPAPTTTPGTPSPSPIPTTTPGTPPPSLTPTATSGM